MKKLFALFCILSMSTGAFAASGIFQSYVILDVDGGGNAFYAGGNNADGATPFTTVALGTPTSLILNGGENKTFKNGGSDVFGAELNYRVYLQGTPAPAFIAVNLPFESNLANPGDQRWQEVAAGIDILSMTTSGGTWVLEVYWRVPSTDGDHFDSNTGANFINTFVVVDGPDITDPCSCTDPMNPPATVMGPGGGEVFHDLVTITSGAGETWQMDATSTGVLDATGAALALPTAMTEGPAGVYTLSLYHERNVGYNGDFSNGTSNLNIANTCTNSCASVPTLNEWGLIIFGLLILNLAALFLVRQSKQGVALGMANK